MNVQVPGCPVISDVDEALELTLGNFAGDSRVNTLDSDCKDDSES